MRNISTFDKFINEKANNKDIEKEADDLYQEYIATKEGDKLWKLARKAMNGNDKAADEIGGNPDEVFAEAAIKHSKKKVSAKVRKELETITYDSFF